MQKFNGTIHSLPKKFAKQGELVLMVGAGVSARSPSSIPGWHERDVIICSALCQRLERDLDEPAFVSSIKPVIENLPAKSLSAPDYQAQVVEEICGDEYFKAFQCLDVNVTNSTHDAIAQLAATGAVRCIVTTNVDSLLEQALDKYRVRYLVAYNEPGYRRTSEWLVSDEPHRTIPLIKIHGSVTDHLSMIDTLKQRRSGSGYLQICLDRLHPSYWIYLGFPATELNTEPRYLNMLNGATYGSGATYVADPRHPTLQKGARLLIEAYEERGEIVVAVDDEYLSALTNISAQQKMLPAVISRGSGREQFEKSLVIWTNSLSPVSAAIYLAGILEAKGEAASAARLLGHLVQKELFDYHDTPAFRKLEFHYGRLHANKGRAENDSGVDENDIIAEQDAVKSLLRLKNTELEFSANSWLCILYLWLNNGKTATRLSVKTLGNIHDNDWVERGPSNPEELADAWISAAQVSVLNAGPEIIRLTISTAEAAYNAVMKSGNVIRAARIVALKGLCLAQTSVDIDRFFDQYEDIFRDAERVGDGFALGFRSLALGRWSISSSNGFEQRRLGSGHAMAMIAHNHLEEARKHLRQGGLEGWVIYARIQDAMALSDIQHFEEAQACINYALEAAERFPVMSTFTQEAIGRILQRQGNPEAIHSFENALDDARESGLHFRSLYLEKIIESWFTGG